MGAPAISRPARPALRRRPAKARTAARPRSRALSPVNALADSGMVMGMTRDRTWIVVLGFLLGGIVALNVWGLGMSASSSATAAKIDQLQRDNSVLGGRIANRLSNETIATAATELGLAVPAADAVTYLNGSGSDVERAAERLANGKISLAPPVAPVTEEIADPAAVTVTDPAAVVPVAPAEPVATEVLPVEPVVPAATAPVTTTTDPAAPVTGAVTP